MTDQLLVDASKIKKHSEGEGFSLPSEEVLQKLCQLATNKLAEIVRRYGAQERLWQGYDASEIAAARELLDKSSNDMVR